jgi:hypothetical protein
MNNDQVFDLEKIKNLTIPIEELQVKLNQMAENSQDGMENIQIIESEFYDKDFLSQLKLIEELLKDITNRLNKVSRSNLTKFLALQDQLIKKYKEKFKDNLISLNLNKDLTKSIGLLLIEDKKISKIIDFVSFIPSIEIPQWLDLLDSLKHNTLYLKSVKKMRIYYQDILIVKLNIELSKIPENTDQLLINDYKKSFGDNPNLTFDSFMKTIESKLTQQERTDKKDIMKKAREREELEKLKKKQKEQNETYENYLKLSDSEFMRIRRKKRREKLTDVSPPSESEEQKDIELSDEVHEKIEKYKSQLNKSFNEKYMIQKDEDQDPLDIIRERKKKKDKEYKEYENHFENS